MRHKKKESSQHIQAAIILIPFFLLLLLLLIPLCLLNTMTYCIVNQNKKKEKNFLAREWVSEWANREMRTFQNCHSYQQLQAQQSSKRITNVMLIRECNNNYSQHIIHAWWMGWMYALCFSLIMMTKRSLLFKKFLFAIMTMMWREL